MHAKKIYLICYNWTIIKLLLEKTFSFPIVLKITEIPSPKLLQFVNLFILFVQLILVNWQNIGVIEQIAFILAM